MSIGMNRNTNIAAVFVIPGPLGGFRFQGLKARSSRQQIGKGKDISVVRCFADAADIGHQVHQVLTALNLGNPSENHNSGVVAVITPRGIEFRFFRVSRAAVALFVLV